MVLLEAMAAGCAVITTSAQGCVEVVGDAAMVVEPGNPTALREALAHLLADDAAIEQLGAAGRVRVRRFASSRVVAQFDNLFRGCLHPRSMPPAPAVARQSIRPALPLPSAAQRITHEARR